MNRPLRIAFAGASGTGKTTLATWLADKLDLPICPVGSRSVASAMGFASPYDVDAAGQRAAFQEKLFLDKRAWEREHRETGFVTDRTHFDNLVYTMMHAPDAITEQRVLDVVDAGVVYDLVFLCPSDRPDDFVDPGDDPARRTERGYHYVYGAAIRGMIQQWTVRGPKVLPERLSDRYTEIRYVLDKRYALALRS